MTERLERRRVRVQAELDRITAAQSALNENPKIAEVIDLVLKAAN